MHNAIHCDTVCTRSSTDQSSKVERLIPQIGFSIEPDESSCLSLCTSTFECRWFSFDASNGFCGLTEDCREVEECANDACTHGQRECGADTGNDNA